MGMSLRVTSSGYRYHARVYARITGGCDTERHDGKCVPILACFDRAAIPRRGFGGATVMMPDAMTKNLVEKIAKGVAGYEPDNRYDVAAMARKMLIARFGTTPDMQQSDVDEAFRVASLYYAELRRRLP